MTDCDDQEYDEEFAEPCEECGRVNCFCDDPMHCQECDTWGAWQCSKHWQQEIELQRQHHEHHAVREALATLASMPDAWHGETWERLLAGVKIVQGGDERVVTLSPEQIRELDIDVEGYSKFRLCDCGRLVQLAFDGEWVPVSHECVNTPPAPIVKTS